jgi:hypothetical protein
MLNILQDFKALEQGERALKILSYDCWGAELDSENSS